MPSLKHKENSLVKWLKSFTSFLADLNMKNEDCPRLPVDIHLISPLFLARFKA
jgi:hypothetical protein